MTQAVPVDAVSFDLVGTLAARNSASSYEAVLLEIGLASWRAALAAALAADVSPLEEAAGDGALWDRAMTSRLERACVAAAVPEQRRAEVVSRLRASDAEPLVRASCAAAVLDELRAAGLLVGVCSNGPPGIIERLRLLGLSERVDAAVASGDLGVRKPAAEPFVELAARLDLPVERIVHVGDEWYTDVVGALGAGMRAVLSAPDGADPILPTPPSWSRSSKSHP